MAPNKGLSAGVASGAAQLLFNSQQLVVLVDALTAGWCACLDLSGVCADGKIGDGGVFSLARAVRDDGRKARMAGQLHCLKRLGDATNLIDLDQDRVRDLVIDAALKAMN